MCAEKENKCYDSWHSWRAAEFVTIIIIYDLETLSSVQAHASTTKNWEKKTKYFIQSPRFSLLALLHSVLFYGDFFLSFLRSTSRLFLLPGSHSLFSDLGWTSKKQKQHTHTQKT